MKLLKFYADWCAPCKALTPVLKEIIDRHPIPMEEVNIETDKEAVTKYGVRSIPTLVIVNDNGDELRKHTGYSVGPAVKRKLEEFVAG